MYELDQNNHKDLIEKCLTGEVNLFTGSGFSIGAKIKSNSIFTTNDLIENLLTDFVGLKDSEAIIRLKKKTFQQICQYAITQKSENEFNEYITRKFINCNPASFHYDYTNFEWKNIFTTNIDDVIESMYKNTDIELQSINTKKQPDEYAGINILKYYKLHGDVNNKSEGFIFSKTQYIEAVVDNKFNYPMLKFSEKLYKDTFCFIGTNFDEIDIEKYISNFQKEKGNQLPKNKIYYISKNIYDEDVVLLNARNIIPIQETAESFIQKLQLFKNERTEHVSNIKIVKKVDIILKLEKMGFDVINKTSLNIDKKSIELYKPIDFYVGYSPKWIDIASNSDAIFEYTSQIIHAIEDTTNFNLNIIIGKSGNGKSTSLKRILFNFSENNDYIVIEHKDLNEINNKVIDDLSKIINSEKKHILIGIDNGSWSLKFIEQVYNKIDSTKKVSFVITTRYPEFYRERNYISSLPKSIKYIDDNLNFDNATKIVNVLDKKGYLGNLAKFSSKEKMVKEFLITNKSNDLFSSLIYATEGKGFFEKINSHIDFAFKDNPIKVKMLVLLALLDKFGSMTLSKSIFYNVFKNEIEDFSKLLYSINDIIDKNSLNGDYIKLRGEYVTTYILRNITKYLSNEEIFNIVSKILMYTSTIYDIDKRRKRSYKTELSSILLNSKHYINYLKIREKSYYDDFYNNLKDYYKELAPFWLYYAKMEMKLEDLDSAWVHLKQAKALNNSQEIEHTIGQWHLIKAKNMTNYLDGYEEFKKGEEIMIKQISNYKDAYPVHTYIEEYIIFNRNFNLKPNSTELKKLIQIINTARNKFNDQIIIQIIWKKFYNFLENIKCANLMKLSFDDLKLMKQIDLSRSAEEQYFLLLTT